MVLRFKILISSGSEKGAQIYCIIFFYPKRPGKQIPSSFPIGGFYGERYPLTGHFYISLDIYLYLKGPVNTASPALSVL
jgi:hypothetical protein